MKRPIALACCLLVFASTAAAEDAATDPDSSPSIESSKSEKTSAELRITLISAAGRWGKVDARSDRVTTHAERSLYYGPGLGTRVFIKQAHHGLLAEFDYRLDSDIDSINSDSAWKTDFVLGRVGYAYRFFRHANERMTWSFSAHGSLSFGGVIDRNEGRLGDWVSARGWVVGGMVGVNVDLHIDRFFFGWAVEYEGLKHLSGTPLDSSHFIRWTLIPVFRIGVDLGPKIQSLDPATR